ncbi:MAG TPA: biopolymer transporter ExbD [Candidatus Thiothrix moscowensis]|jgi:biopolymer transport protein ExbD|uniref:ExbD/TolR family protein n=1 Tax=unclassified Thiothrix TaxID=2636184 RepID=UPI001A1C622F|nr:MULTISPECIES: biopolymer transporter ExbD [unclassified Thiothrix]MBJ6611322.1 biopolymer transporter ExbD [Candidatus Thiothrix moscowensis]HRJ53244.1 biopolymer transporter ExbD [Candidatus Thiothrix moscowensis]HRJ93186.1 biopolymer transporter ExbD [Candidatus Thiothrix moscowensis]
MKFRTRERTHSGVDLTSLIDVVFMLLIFFMVTTTFDKNAELKIELPTASNTASTAVQDKLELLIDGQGRYYINGREVLNNQPETLFQAMSQTLEDLGNNTPPLVISADANVDYQAVVTAMDIAGRLGLTNFSLATSQSSRKPQE